MSSKRTTKKQIRYTCGDLAAECILAKTFIPGVKENEMANIIIEIAKLQQEALEKASIATNKEAFHALNAEFNKTIEEIVKKMNAALPAEEKKLRAKTEE